MEDLKKRVESDLIAIKEKIDQIKTNNPDYKKLSKTEYLWLISAANIYYVSDDLLGVITYHTKSQNKIKRSLYTLFRSILEDYFYIKFTFANLSEVDKHFNALIVVHQQNSKKHLDHLLKLYKNNKFIPASDPQSVLTVENLNIKVTEYENDINKRKKYTTSSLIGIYTHVEQVARQYDKVKGITSIKPNTEVTSHEWLYDYIYRFNSYYSHQGLNVKEDVLDLIWFGKSYTDNNEEVLSLMGYILEEVLSLYGHISKKI